MRSHAGTWLLIRVGLRRDRVILPIWISVFVMMAASSASATEQLYGTMSSRVSAMRAINNVPAVVALYGRVYSDSVGAVSLIKMSGLGAAMLAILAFALVVRHSRADEESGRMELMGSTAVGRRAPLWAALLISMGTSVAIGLLSTAGLAAAGLPAPGSLAFGSAWAATGCAFAAVGAVVAQLTTGTRAAIGLASAFLGFAYLVRGVGDVMADGGAGWISWLSPIAWGQQVRPFATERWGVLLLLGAFTIGGTCVAFALADRRDLGAGLFADRSGPATAGASLSSSLGLSWRLERGAALAWSLAMLLSGAILGSIASQVGGMLDSPAAREFIVKLGGTYLAVVLGMFGVIVCVFGMSAIMRARTEEGAWRADVALSTATSRSRWLGSHVVVAVVGSALILLLGGIAAGLGDALQLGGTDRFGQIVTGVLVQLPAVWVMLGLTVAVFAFLPRRTKAAWGIFVAFLLLGEFGQVFDLPRWVMDISPFAHTPRLPGGVVEIGPLAWLTLTAVALMAAGFARFQTRDIG